MPLAPIKASDDLIKDLDHLAQELEKLKGVYEQYFLGLNRIEPAKLREKVVGMIRKYSTVPIQSARPKFRYTQLVNRYNTYSVYWDRILREIDEGRYERDVFRAKIHEKERHASATPGRPSPPQSVAPEADPMKAIFDAYAAEKGKNKEDLAALSFEKFRTQMTAQVEALKKKLGAQGITLKVVTEGGKAKIKAIPQKNRVNS
ncbi:MAG: MXAN_5187 C-terminal domain-containing protein [Pseudomonadota bacterium]